MPTGRSTNDRDGSLLSRLPEIVITGLIAGMTAVAGVWLTGEYNRRNTVMQLEDSAYLKVLEVTAKENKVVYDELITRYGDAYNLAEGGTQREMVVRAWHATDYALMRLLPFMHTRTANDHQVFVDMNQRFLRYNLFLHEVCSAIDPSWTPTSIPTLTGTPIPIPTATATPTIGMLSHPAATPTATTVTRAHLQAKYLESLASPTAYPATCKGMEPGLSLRRYAEYWSDRQVFQCQVGRLLFTTILREESRPQGRPSC
jgi:hypothetical protein